VLRKYLLEAAEEITVKGVPLAERLYIPEPFSENSKVEAAQRRREKLAVLRPRDGQTPLAIVIGEYKISEATAQGHRVWIRHMPDAPLLIAGRAWERIERVFAPLFEARDADIGHSVRLVIAALICARREYTYEIDSVSLMLTSEQWIPIEGVHELPLSMPWSLSSAASSSRYATMRTVPHHFRTRYCWMPARHPCHCMC
jgi:hypothetical protein